MQQDMIVILDLGSRQRELIDQAQLVEAAEIDKIFDPIH